MECRRIGEKNFWMVVERERGAWCGGWVGGRSSGRLLGGARCGSEG